MNYLLPEIVSKPLRRKLSGHSVLDMMRKELEGKGTEREGGSLDYGSQIDGGGGKLQLRRARFVSCKRDTSVNQVHNQQRGKAHRRTKTAVGKLNTNATILLCCRRCCHRCVCLPSMTCLYSRSLWRGSIIPSLFPPLPSPPPLSAMLYIPQTCFPSQREVPW